MPVFDEREQRFAYMRDELAPVIFAAGLLLYPFLILSARFAWGMTIRPELDERSLLLQALLLLLILLSFFLSRSKSTWPFPVKCGLWAFIISHLILVCAAWTHGEGPRLSYLPALLFPILLLIKPLATNQIRKTVALALGGITLLALATVTIERSFRFGSLPLPILTDLGITRSFTHFADLPAFAGLVAIGVMFLGLATQGIWRHFYFAVGLVGLLFSGSEGMILASIAGFAVLGVTASSSRWLVPVVLTLIALIGAAVYFVQRNPTGSGRIEVWTAFIAAWRTSPLVGVGSEFLNSGIAHMHADGHNAYIDTLTRYGVVGALAAVGLIATVILIAIFACRAGNCLSLALASSIALAAVFDVQPRWLFWSFGSSLLLAALLVAAIGFPRETKSVGMNEHAERKALRKPG